VHWPSGNEEDIEGNEQCFRGEVLDWSFLPYSSTVIGIVPTSTVSY